MMNVRSSGIHPGTGSGRQASAYLHKGCAMPHSHFRKRRHEQTSEKPNSPKFALNSSLIHRPMLDNLRLGPNAPFLKDGTQKCVSDASAVSADDPTPRVLLDG